MSDESAPAVYVQAKDLLVPLEVQGPLEEVTERVADLVKNAAVLDVELVSGSRLVIHFGRLTCVWISDRLPEGPTAAVVEL